jgi:CRP-like cAMP-binding protein
MDRELHQKILSRLPLFQSLTLAELEQIVPTSRLLRVKRGVTVVEEGEEGTAMYFVVEGRCHVHKRLPNGDSTLLAPIPAGSVFGEMALIDHSPRSASVVTAEDTVLYQIDLVAFNRLREQCSPAAYKVLREIAPVLCQRLRHLTDRVGEFFKSPTDSLAELERRFVRHPPAVHSRGPREG